MKKFKRNYYSKKWKDELDDKFKKKFKNRSIYYYNKKVTNSKFPAYESTKKKKHCLLYTWKHETGIKINFDLWEPYK